MNTQKKKKIFLTLLSVSILGMVRCGGGGGPTQTSSVPPVVYNGDTRLADGAFDTSTKLADLGTQNRDSATEIAKLRSQLNGVGKTGGDETAKLAAISGPAVGDLGTKKADNFSNKPGDGFNTNNNSDLLSKLKDNKNDSNGKSGGGGSGDGGGGSGGGNSGFSLNGEKTEPKDTLKKDDKVASAADGGGLYSGGGGAHDGDANGAASGQGITGMSDENFAFGGQGANRDPATIAIEDPEDYFNRISIDENLFKRVERRYVKKSLAWLLQDTREIVSKK
ncbi:MAG: hypothetical protein HY843_06120 [Bdellovibrio sp.]|nr:hypothetical protein [Bdellovibrio sp.]